MQDKIPLQRLDGYRWQIPEDYMPGMRVPGIIYASENMLGEITSGGAPQQVANTAFLPGIVRYSMAMPDIHWGYGFCIGGVAAVDPDKGGTVSPGGIGYDINCGVRLIRTDLSAEEIGPYIDKLISGLFRNIPCGVGEKGEIRVKKDELKRIASEGAVWAVKKGYGEETDITYTEEEGRINGADPSGLSIRALERGLGQAGTLGSGNHFIEIQEVEEIHDRKTADIFGLFEGQAVIMIHSGSRGFGYQICADSLKYLAGAPKRYGYTLPDRQLVCAPVKSPEGRRYINDMSCAANYAWANRQVLTHLARRVFENILGKGYNALGMRLVYDVAHNIGKFEEYNTAGGLKKLFVHRKGATRAFPAGHSHIPDRYRETGHPVLVPGSMGTNSYIMAGTQRAVNETFGSVCHGAGRLLSRHKAVNMLDYTAIKKGLSGKGIIVMCRGKKGLLEEAPEVYKDINNVVDTVHNAGIAKKTARLKPLGAIKG